MSQACIMAGIEGQRPHFRREAPPDDRGTQGQGKREQYFSEKTPLEWRAELDKLFGSKYVGAVTHLNNDRSETTLRAYRFTYVREGFWPRAGALASAEHLNYLATQAGYGLWGSPVLVDQAGQQEKTGKATSDFWLYFEEVPGIDVTLKRGEVKGSPTFRSKRDNPIHRDSYGFPFDKGKPLHELVYEQVLAQEEGQEAQEAPLEGLYHAGGEAGSSERTKWDTGERYEHSEVHIGGIPHKKEERGSFYEDIGLSAAEFKTRVAEMRELLRTVRQRYGQDLNAADFLRERIDQGIRHLIDRDLDKWDDELIASYEDLANGWNVMAFDRYSPQRQRRELEENGYNLALFRAQGGVLVSKKAAAMLDIMATALDLPHTLAQQIDTFDPRQKTYGQAGFDSDEKLERNYLIKVSAIEK